MIRIEIAEDIPSRCNDGNGRICFGAGKYFSRFVSQHPEVEILAVIDNYLYKEKDRIELPDGRSIKTISPGEFNREESGCETLILTSAYFSEMLEQIRDDERFDGVTCLLTPDATGKSIDDLKEALKIFEEKCLDPNKAADGKHFLLWEGRSDTKLAGTKAPVDVKDILSSEGYEVLTIHCSGNTGKSWRHERSEKEWQDIEGRVSEGSILVTQHPFWEEDPVRDEALFRLKEKKVRFVSVVHDVEKLREINMTSYMQQEYERMLELADILIVHNEAMKGFFIEEGFPAENIIPLGVFDYLYDSGRTEEAAFDRSVSYAGALGSKKSRFIYGLGELSPICINLFGPNYDPDSFGEKAPGKNINYHGAYPPEEIPEKLNSGFGLVWDGESVDACDGPTGRYLRYINPHKLSLYLAAGIPVIIWNGSAEAPYVREKNIGFTVDSLKEIRERLDLISANEYEIYVKNVQNVSEDIKKGNNMRRAIKEAERKILNEQ